jgi:hypothetical protein
LFRFQKVPQHLIALIDIVQVSKKFSATECSGGHYSGVKEVPQHLNALVDIFQMPKKFSATECSC